MHGQDACAVTTSGNTQDGIAANCHSPVTHRQIHRDSLSFCLLRPVSDIKATRPVLAVRFV